MENMRYIDQLGRGTYDHKSNERYWSKEPDLKEIEKNLY